MGSLTVITGCMFSGKTEKLIQAVEDLRTEAQIRVFKHQLDDRYEGSSRICSHTGKCIDAIPVASSVGIDARVRPHDEIIFIEEAQFFDKYLPRVVDKLIQQGKTVIVAGTDTDFKGDIFGPMLELILMSEEPVWKLTATCAVCGGMATRNQRLRDGLPVGRNDPVIMVGASDTYEPRCPTCHEVRD